MGQRGDHHIERDGRGEKRGGEERRGEERRGEKGREGKAYTLLVAGVLEAAAQVGLMLLLVLDDVDAYLTAALCAACR